MSEVWVAYCHPTYDTGHLVGVGCTEAVARVLAQTDSDKTHPNGAVLRTWVPPLWDDADPRETRIMQLDYTDYYVAPCEVVCGP